MSDQTDTPAGRFEALADNALITPYRDSDAAREFASWCFNNRSLILSALRAAEGDGWLAIETHDGTTKHVEGWNKEMGAHETWYFVPSSRTRDWWIVGIQNRKWTPTHWRPLPALPASGEGEG